MSQPNIKIVAGKHKKNRSKKFWAKLNSKIPPSTIIIHNSIKSVTEVRTLLPPGGNVPILTPPQPALVELVDDNSPHIPTINKNAPENPGTIIAADTAKNIAASLAKKKVANTAKKNIAKNVAQVNTLNVTKNETNSALHAAGNPFDNQQTGELNPNLVKKFTNQEKKRWKKYKANLARKLIKQKMSWLEQAEASTTENDPGTSDSPQIQEASQSGPSTLPPQVNVAPAVTSMSGNNKEYNNPIPTLEPTTHTPNITLKTKKSLQQEMVRQRLNWIKPNPNLPGNVAGPSGIPQEMNQSVPLNDAPPIIVAPQPQPIAGPVPAMPIMAATPQVVIPRSNAGSFFKAAAAPTQPSPKKPRAPKDLFAYMKYPKGIPKSFLLQQQLSQEPGGQPITADSPIWPNNNMMMYQMNAPTSVLPQQPPMSMGDNMNQATSPIYVQTENPVDVQQQYSPSDIYSEHGNNPEPSEDAESCEQNQAGQKRLSAFQRLGPLSQPKKPKLTINLTLNKEQPVREVVDDTDDDPDRYTPVHLRQDIIMSTDETVRKYLTSWPWRKNVGIRRSATARQSRSVMILEQEQMEEAYEKDNFFIQITVKGYPSTWTKERVLDAVLDSVMGYSLIPCFTEFYQHECKFLTLRSRSALVVLHKTGFYIHKDGVELTVTISLTDLTLNQIDFLPRLILRKRVTMGYVDKKLNLSAFTLQNDISHFIYFPLSRVSNQSEFIQLQSVVNWENLTELDLSHNRLTSISGFDLHIVAPRLKHLNLSHNYLEKITILINYRQLPLKTIHLEGNPLCHDYIDPEHYIKVVRMMFPAVVEIDGVPIHRKGEIPQFKQNFCPEEAQEVTEKFLEIFFPLLDSGPDHRSLIQGMYEDDANLTITYCYKLRYGQIYRCFRNLFLYARFLDEGETDSVVGAMSITKLINRWPHTEHDPFTFTVDVMYHSESTTILRIGGILKLTAETLAEDEHLLAFTRTVVLYSEHGDEYKIQNEMVYWDEPTAAAARAAFRVNTISQKSLNLKIESTTDEDLRDKFLKIFMKLTTMDKKISERCLELNNWNFKLALEHFTKLLKTNNLESLTQELQVTS